MGGEEVQAGSEEGEAPYSVRGFTVDDGCPECDYGFLRETPLGLACDECTFDVPDPRKFRKDDPAEEWPEEDEVDDGD